MVFDRVLQDLLHSIHITDADVKMYFPSADPIAWEIKALCQEKVGEKKGGKKEEKRNLAVFLDVFDSTFR